MVIMSKALCVCVHLCVYLCCHQTWKKARMRRHCPRKFLRYAEIFRLWKIIISYFKREPYIFWKKLNIQHIFRMISTTILFILQKFWDVVLRKFQLQTKCVRGRIKAFSMSVKIGHNSGCNIKSTISEISPQQNHRSTWKFRL